MNSPEKSERSQTVLSIQALRAVAAIAVLVPHITSDFARYLNQPDTFPAFAIGGAGVDLFFVISGFVMVYASERLFQRDRGSLIFITHRIIRIVPLYWLVTTLYLIVSFALPDFAKNYPLAFLIGSYVHPDPAARWCHGAAGRPRLDAGL
jgi:peptidoglycan/LPS O-acetylase OafA/YrhL